MILTQIMQLLQTQMETPKPYGLWHICFLILTAGACVLSVILCRNVSDKTMRRILAVIWGVLVVLEIYKQIVFSHSVVDGVVSFRYQWFVFPFQFCSTPLYALPFLIFLKDGPVRNFFMVFTTGFVMFAGLVVMLYPNDVFASRLGINFQTMIHHGAQVVLGVMLTAYGRRNMTLRNLGGSVAVFSLFAAVAMAINEITYAVFTAKGITEVCNMFYISRHYACTLPILSTVYNSVPYPLFLLVYIVGFALVAALFFGIEKGIMALAMRKKNYENTK